MKSDNNKPMAQTGKGYLFPAVIPAALCFLLALAGCRNMFENPGTGNQTPPEGGNGLVAVTGQISLSGAFPGALQSSTGSQRTAIPTVGEVTYTVTAQNKVDPEKTVTASVEDDFSYTLYLSPGTWTLSCSGINDSGSQIIKEKEPVELTVTQGGSSPQPGTLELVLPQTPVDGGTGNVRLSGAINFVKDDTTVTLDITLTPWESSVTAPDIPQQTVTGNGNFTVTLDAVPSGAYIMTLVFSVDGIAVSTVEEAVNVFDNMTTDTWYVGGGNSDHLTPQQDGSAVFNLTRCRTEFFIDGDTGEDTNSGSALNPLKTLGKAFSVLGKIKDAEAKITLQSDAGDTAGVTVPEGVNAVIFGEEAARIPELITVGDGATVKVGTNVTCTGGAMVQSGGVLTLTQGGTIDGAALFSGLKDGNGGAVYVDGGTFTMENGSTVTGGNITGNGSGVYVNGGTFTMNGGTVTGGQAQYGGGVYIDTDGTFTMNGNAVIEGNKATQNNKGGGGVYVNNGTFTMTGGTIGGDNKNTAMNGGGVYVDANGSFTMDGNAVISNNEVERNGGGVCVFGTFTMKGSAAIRGNNANTTKRWNGGGGVLVCEGGQFEMTGDAVIENNHTDGTGKDDADNNGVNGCGGGVLVRDPGSAFTMSGNSRITGNTAVDHGGGVYVDDIFTVSGTPSITDNTVNSTPNNVYLPSGKTIICDSQGLTGGNIGVTAEATAPGNAVQITDTDVTGAVRILISDDATYSVAEGVATSEGSGTAVFLSDAEVAYKSSSELGKTLGKFAEAYGGKVTEITLLKDITPTTASGFSWPIVFDWICTLDLNGHAINRELSSETDDGQVVVISSNGNLTIKDSSANADGTGGIGKITGGYDSGNGMNYGGGGGVYVGSGCTFTMLGGSITDNGAINGGGVYVSIDGIFTMRGGSISGNGKGETELGAGVCDFGEFTMTGGSITGNILKSYGSNGFGTGGSGGGVYVSSGAVFSVGGSPIINGNEQAGNLTNENDVYLDSAGAGAKISIRSDLDRTGKRMIGIYMEGSEGKYTITSGWNNSSVGELFFGNYAAGDMGSISGYSHNISVEGNEIVVEKKISY